jgi:hypothetical protein
VSLRNLLPFPGIEEILHLLVIEAALYPYQEMIHTFTITSTSRPFKATLVWMDPDNSYLSTRMLLNNLDLRIVTPQGEVLYGNNIAGDEVNNVSHVTVCSSLSRDLSPHLSIIG